MKSDAYFLGLRMVIGAVDREAFLAMPSFFLKSRHVFSRGADFNMADRIFKLNTGTSVPMCF